MLRNSTSSDGILKSSKLPIKNPRTSVCNLKSISNKIIQRKYMQVTTKAFHFQKIHACLKKRYKYRQLQLLSDNRQYGYKYYNFQEIKNCIKSVITQRVEKDFLFGINFHVLFYPLLEKYQRCHKNLKQRNLYNRYYFSNQPPKISVITQATANSYKPPETNSTIELKALADNLSTMLATKKKTSDPRKKFNPFSTPQKKMKFDRNQKQKKLTSSKKTKHILQNQQQSYGLKNYLKENRFLKTKGKSKDKQSLCINIKYCITPQPHSLKDRQFLPKSSSHARLSQRKTGSTLSRQKNKKNS